MLKQINTIRFFVLFATAALILSSCNKWKDYFPHDGGGGKKKTISEIVSDNYDYKLLKVALKHAGLYETLDQAGTFTVFAPDNKAFADAGFPDAAAIKAVAPDALKGILLYHVLGSVVKSGDIPVADNTAVTTVGGGDIYVSSRDGKVSVNGASVVKADIKASNGVIHAINKVLMPPSSNIVELAVANPNLSYLVAAVLRASQGTTDVAALLSGAGPFTVFAPTNDAFIAAGFATIDAINAANPDDLTPILAYHVIGARVFSANLVDGAEVPTVNGANVKIDLSSGAAVKGNSNASASNVVAADVIATNGVVHVVDQVLLP